MSPGAPWFARGGWPPRPRAERPIVPDIFPDCPPGLESLRTLQTPDGVEVRRRMATDPASTLEQLVSVIDACPAQVVAAPLACGVTAHGRGASRRGVGSVGAHGTVVGALRARRRAIFGIRSNSAPRTPNRTEV